MVHPPKLKTMAWSPPWQFARIFPWSDSSWKMDWSILAPITESLFYTYMEYLSLYFEMFIGYSAHHLLFLDIVRLKGMHFLYSESSTMNLLKIRAIRTINFPRKLKFVKLKHRSEARRDEMHIGLK